MLTRPKVSVTVVKAPTMSYSPARRASCSAQALSLPLDQAIRAFGKARIRNRAVGKCRIAASRSDVRDWA